MSRPTGTVTFLFSDIEGSTERWERHSQWMPAALERHDAVMRASIEAHRGHVFKVVGDSFYAAFASPPDALAAAVRAQRALAAADFSSVDGLRVRMALHTGESQERDGDYFGGSVNRIARLLAIGHGGQVLVSGTAADLLRDALPADHALRDLGLHGLKDLSRAERVYQVVAPDLGEVFPPLRSLDRLPNNLPAQLTSFVGRESEVAEIDRLLQRSPLVTLAGPGGIGKTRCAIAAAGKLLESSPDGAWLIDLAPLADASLVAGAIAQTLGVREVPERPLLETLAAHLESRHLLLILDNCEHVLDEVRALTVAILRRCPHVRIVATSREPLNVGGEQVLRLPSLEARDSIALFADRATSADHRFSLSDDNLEHVAAIAARVDGMPLAIELAAARVKVLSPAQIVQRLDERFRVLTGGDRSALPRRQTLRATIDWSYDLLEERERALFRGLAVFAGSFGLDAAVAVCGAQDQIDEWDVLDLLGALVDKSLVATEPSGEGRRCRLLQSMREYGLELLRESGEEADVAERHAHFYAQFVATLAPLVESLEDEQWRNSCAPELDNLRAAIDWTLFNRHDPASGIALLSEIEWPEILTTPQEALRWYGRAAEEAGAMPDARTRARILRHCVRLKWLVGTPLVELRATAERAVEVAKTAGDADELARALANLGAVHRTGGHFDEAEAAFTAAYANPEALSRLTTNAVLRLWAVTDLQRGDVESARRRFGEVVRSERPGSETHASALLNLGELEYAVGNVAAAREAARRARETYETLGSTYLVLVLSNLAAYALAADDLKEAREVLRDALDVQRRSTRGWLATLLEHRALLAALDRDWERAATLLGFTAATYSARGNVRQRTEQRGYDRLVGLMEGTYDAAELERLMSAGARLKPEEALALAATIYVGT